MTEFSRAKRCQLCKHFDYQHGEYGCLAKRTDDMIEAIDKILFRA